MQCILWCYISPKAIIFVPAKSRYFVESLPQKGTLRRPSLGIWENLGKECLARRWQVCPAVSSLILRACMMIIICLAVCDFILWYAFLQEVWHSFRIPEWAWMGLIKICRWHPRSRFSMAMPWLYRMTSPSAMIPSKSTWIQKRSTWIKNPLLSLRSDDLGHTRWLQALYYSTSLRSGLQLCGQIVPRVISVHTTALFSAYSSPCICRL